LSGLEAAPVFQGSQSDEVMGLSGLEAAPVFQGNQFEKMMGLSGLVKEADLVVSYCLFESMVNNHPRLPVSDAAKLPYFVKLKKYNK